MRFVHCSDVHITADYSQIPLRKLGWRRWIALLELGLGGRARAYAAASTTLGKIAQEVLQGGADHLILSGDLTAYALEQEFAGARQALGELGENPKLCTVIPGNHDVYTPGAVRGARFEKYFHDLLASDLPEYRREGDFPFVRLLGEEAVVIGLCSARPPLVPGFSFGTIGRAQLSAVAEILRDKRVSGRAVLVVVHHAPFREDGKRDRRLHGLTDARALLELLPGPRFAVLHGHIHHRYHHLATASSPHIFGAGSSTQKGREGYWVIDVANGLVNGAQAMTLSSEAN